MSWWPRAVTSTAFAVSLVALTAPGCFGTQCDFKPLGTWGKDPGQGRLIDAQTWESTSVDGPWLEFPPHGGWEFHVPAWGQSGRVPTEFHAWVSFASEPNAKRDIPDNWAPAAGNLAEFSAALPGYVRVFNDTCTPYSVRVVLRADPLPPPTPPLDAGIDASDDASSDASASDAPNDTSEETP